MLSSILLFSILVLGCSAGINGAILSICPTGSLPTPTDQSTCYFFGTGNVYYLEAEEICHQNGGHLASIHNMMDNMFMTQEAFKAFPHSTAGDFWFGLSNIIQDSFSWVDTTPFDFINWAEGAEPAEGEKDARCGAVIKESGQWHTAYCFDKKPFVCAVPSLPIQKIEPLFHGKFQQK